MKDRFCFRGFHKEENGKETIYIDNFPIKGNWVEGYYSKTDLGMFINQYRVDYEDECTYCEDFEVIPETIGQCVGLSDKNGRLIFENDVVKARYENNNGYIKWNSDNASFQVKGIPSHTLKRAEDLELIGTIFDKEVKE